MSLKIQRLPAIKAAQAAVAESTQQAYTISQVAAILAVSKKTIFNAMKAGKIRTFKVLGCTRISADEVRRLANAGTMATAEQIADYYENYANPLMLAVLNRDTNGRND